MKQNPGMDGWMTFLLIAGGVVLVWTYAVAKGNNMTFGNALKGELAFLSSIPSGGMIR